MEQLELPLEYPKGFIALNPYPDTKDTGDYVAEFVRRRKLVYERFTIPDKLYDKWYPKN